MNAIPTYSQPPKHPLLEAIKRHLENQDIPTRTPPVIINYSRFDTKTHIIYYNEFTNTIRIRPKTESVLELERFTDINPNDPQLLTKITHLLQP